MNKFLLVAFLFMLLLNSCAKQPKNAFPTSDQIDAMSLNEMTKYAQRDIDPFSKDTSYYVLLYNDLGEENKYADCIIDSNGAHLVIKPNVYLSDYVDIKIISKHNPLNAYSTS